MSLSYLKASLLTAIYNVTVFGVRKSEHCLLSGKKSVMSFGSTSRATQIAPVTSAVISLPVGKLVHLIMRDADSFFQALFLHISVHKDVQQLLLLTAIFNLLHERLAQDIITQIQYITIRLKNKNMIKISSFRQLHSKESEDDLPLSAKAHIFLLIFQFFP